MEAAKIIKSALLTVFFGGMFLVSAFCQKQNAAQNCDFDLICADSILNKTGYISNYTFTGVNYKLWKLLPKLMKMDEIKSISLNKEFLYDQFRFGCNYSGYHLKSVKCTAESKHLNGNYKIFLQFNYEEEKK